MEYHFSKLSIDHLEDAIDAVDAVYEEGEGAFARLANAKGIDPSVLSVRLRKFERIIGHTLFETRDGNRRKGELTPCGYVLRKYGRAVKLSLARLADEIDKSKKFKISDDEKTAMAINREKIRHMRNSDRRDEKRRARGRD